MPIGDILNALIWPIAIWAAPYWILWNILTIPLALLFFIPWLLITGFLFLLQMFPSIFLFIPSLFILSTVCIFWITVSGLVNSYISIIAFLVGTVVTFGLGFMSSIFIIMFIII